MSKNFDDCPQILREYLFYLQTIKGLSPRTVDGYYIDLRTFLRFMKLHKKFVPTDTELSNIVIDDIDINFISVITLSDVYEFLHYVSTQRENSAVTRSRKTSSIRSFFNYLTVKKHLLSVNPVKELEVPGTKKSLPKYLTLEQSKSLLGSVSGEYAERDYCILTLFLNCGMRLSELVSLNTNCVMDNQIKLLGKGNKERIVYLNDACKEAIKSYLAVRSKINISPNNRNALFVSSRGNRICKRRVQGIVENALKACGLEGQGLSTHKLRHTAATLMYQYGNVDIRVLQEILGHANLGTTEIYTHVSNKQLESATNSSPLANVKTPKKLKE